MFTAKCVCPFVVNRSPILSGFGFVGLFRLRLYKKMLLKTRWGEREREREREAISILLIDATEYRRSIMTAFGDATFDSSWVTVR